MRSNFPPYRLSQVKLRPPPKSIPFFTLGRCTKTMQIKDLNVNHSHVPVQEALHMKLFWTLGAQKHHCPCFRMPKLLMNEHILLYPERFGTLVAEIFSFLCRMVTSTVWWECVWCTERDPTGRAWIRLLARVDSSMIKQTSGANYLGTVETMKFLCTGGRVDDWDKSGRVSRWGDLTGVFILDGWKIRREISKKYPHFLSMD